MNLALKRLAVETYDKKLHVCPPESRICVKFWCIVKWIFDAFDGVVEDFWRIAGKIWKKHGGSLENAFKIFFQKHFDSLDFLS